MNTLSVYQFCMGSRAYNKSCRKPVEGLCTMPQIGGQIQTSVHSGTLLLAVQDKEKLSGGKVIIINTLIESLFICSYSQLTECNSNKRYPPPLILWHYCLWYKAFFHINFWIFASKQSDATCWKNVSLFRSSRLSWFLALQTHILMYVWSVALCLWVL